MLDDPEQTHLLRTVKKATYDHPIYKALVQLCDEHLVTTGAPNEYFTPTDDDRVRILLA